MVRLNSFQPWRHIESSCANKVYPETVRQLNCLHPYYKVSFNLLTHFMRDTLLGVPLGKQVGSQIRPHIVGPDLRSNLFAARSIFYQKLPKSFQIFELFLEQTTFQNGRQILPSIQWVK